jgi:hypothetical protein
LIVLLFWNLSFNFFCPAPPSVRSILDQIFKLLLFKSLFNYLNFNPLLEPDTHCRL